MAGNTINAETKIEITLGKFVGLLTSLLTAMFLFYTYVIVPKLESIEKNSNEKITELNERVDKGFENTNAQLLDISNGMGVMSGNIDGINNRFRDLSRIRDNHTEASGGFGNN